MKNADNPTRTRADRRSNRVPAGFFDRFFIEAAGQALRESDMYIGGVLVLGGPVPSFEALRDHLAARARRIPVLGYRLVGDGREGWEEDSGFDPRDHIDAVSLAPGTDVLAASFDVIARPLPPDRPLWGLTVMRGHSDDEYALCYRAHHSFQDGVGVVHVASALLSTSPPGKPAERPAGERIAARRGSTSRSWRALADFGIPLRRTAVDWPPFTHPLTGRRVLVTARLDAAELRDVAAATGASTHQVCLTAIAGAIREWTPHGWSGGRDPYVLIPLDLKRSRTVAEPGNHLGVLRVKLPCGEPSALTRLRVVMSRTGPDHVLRHRNRYRRLLHALPHRVASAFMRRLTNPRYMSMVVSTLRAPIDVAAENGAVRGLYALPPLLPGQHGMVVVLQQPDTVTVSVVLDECVPDADRFPKLVVRAVARLRAEATSASPGGGGRSGGAGTLPE